MNYFRSHSSSEFYKKKISVRSSQKLLLLLHSPCLSGALCPSLCCLLAVEQTKSYMFQAAVSSPVLFAKNLSLCPSLYLSISLSVSVSLQPALMTYMFYLQVLLCRRMSSKEFFFSACTRHTAIDDGSSFPFSIA